MANWYYTKFTLAGRAADIEAAHALLTSLPVDSDGELSLTYIAGILGCDPEQTFSAGYIDTATISLGDGCLDFATWTKWQPPYQIVYAICRRYASLRYYFMAFLEEYYTNDAEGRFYPERVYVELSQGDTLTRLTTMIHIASSIMSMSSAKRSNSPSFRRTTPLISFSSPPTALRRAR